MTRSYKANRRPVPPLAEIVAGRRRGESMADIADTWGCERRTVYAALDRWAGRGHLAPKLLPVLFPDDADAQKRLARIMGAAFRDGVAIPGAEKLVRRLAERGELSEEARRRVAEVTTPATP